MNELDNRDEGCSAAFLDSQMPKRLDSALLHREAVAGATFEYGSRASGIPLLEAFPAGNSTEAPIKSGRGCSILVAKPHPYADVSRLRPAYEAKPHWQRMAEESLDDEAAAVIETFPGDVEAVKTMLLPALGFCEPYTVLPVYESLGTQTPHGPVLVIARRPSAPPSADSFQLYREQFINPVYVGRRMIPSAKAGLVLFAPRHFWTLDPWRDSRMHWRVSYDGVSWLAADE